MGNITGIEKPNLTTLPQIKDRMTFIYLEHCKINRQDSAITATDEDGTVFIPAGSISVLLLGPGTNISHRAIELIGDVGVSVIWVGEHGVRFYASGRSMTHSAALLQKQAELVSNQRKHLDIVRKMYILRFPEEDVSSLTLQQLRGREGARVRKVYKEMAEKWDIDWKGRSYKANDHTASDPVNQALSLANSCLYGVALSVIAALGCSPGLGFVHVGHESSFVYDIADLYKAETAIPIAFEAASMEDIDMESYVRKSMRDKYTELHLIERMVKDIKYLLSDESKSNEENDAVYLWDNKIGTVANAKSY